MTDIYDRAKALATRMLAPRGAGGKGLELTLRKSTTGEYDPNTSSTPVTTTDYVGSGFRANYELKDIDGTLIKSGDVKFIVSPALAGGGDMPAPETGDLVLFNGQEYLAISVSPWNYAGLAVGFEVQGRGNS